MPTEERPKPSRRFGMFFLISFFGFGIDTALLNVLVTFGGLHGSPRSTGAKAISSVCASFLMFLMHRHMTFRDRPGPFFRELGRYSLVRSSAVAVSIGLFSGLHFGFYHLLSQYAPAGRVNVWSANLAQIGTSMTVLVLSYVAHHKFTFARSLGYGMQHGKRDVRVDHPS